MKALSKFLLLIIAIMFLATIANAQDSVYHVSYLKTPVYRPGEIIQAKNVSQLVDVEIPANKSYKIVEVVYDSTWEVVEYNNTSAAIVYSSGWVAGIGQTKFINTDFQYGRTMGTERTATLTVTVDQQFRMALLSERFAGHGDYTVQIDSGPITLVKAGQAPFGSDKDMNVMSFKSPVLDKGTHKITVRSSQQMVIDAFRVLKLTLVPR